MENQIQVQQLLELDVQTLETLDQCSDAFGRVSQAADDHAGKAVSLGKAAIMYAVKGGLICLRAKELCDHGQFGDWKEEQCRKYGRSPQTLERWMKLAKSSLMRNLLEDPKYKGLTDAYIATGLLPEPEPKAEAETDKDKAKLPWSPLKFSTRIDDWTKEAALDWLYEYDRAGQWARALRMQFGLT
jgi:transposase-like protein